MNSAEILSSQRGVGLYSLEYMIRKVLKSCRKLDPDMEIERYVLGVSGGADSVALLHCLSELKDSLGVELAVVHVNHNARGAESDDDAAFVKSLCRKLDIRCTVKSVNVAACAEERKISFEMAAREARYECFVAEAEKGKLNTAVVTAHTRDDQAETVLIKLARGAGVRGLAGIPARGTVGGTALLRPMLAVSRKEIISFLRRHHYEWREDSSNSSTDFLRNRVRSRLLPMMEEDLNPDIRTTLARTAEVLREDDELLQSVTDGALEACSVSSCELDLAELRREHRAIIRRVLMTWLSVNGVRSENLDIGLIGAVEKLIISRKANSSMKVSGGIYIVREYDRLCVGKSKAASAPQFSVSLKPPGRVLLNAVGLLFEAAASKDLIREKGRPGKYPAKATVSSKAVGRKKLTLRSWKPGDRIKPIGMNGSKKVKDVLMDLKVPASVRGRVPVVECAGEIIWIPGCHVARDWAVGSGEQSIALFIREA